MRVLLIDYNPYMPAVTPISLGNLAAVVKSSGHEVKVISFGSTSRYSLSGLVSFLMDFNPRLIGFGAYQRNLLSLRSIAKIAKRTLSECYIVLGGPQATFLPDSALLQMPEIDFISRGEGELVIQDIVEAIDGEYAFKPIAGVTLRTKGGGCLFEEAKKPPMILDCYASPWQTGVLNPAELDESIMLTSRGCPNNCAFCFTPAAFGRKTRAQSVDRVLEDIACICQTGTGRLWFADPNFSFNQNRVIEILEGILRRGLKVCMWVETRADMLTPEIIKLMKQAGVHSIAMGLESASPNVYPQLDKNIDPGQIERAVRNALKDGLDVELFSQYALPYERFEDAMQTLSFVKNCGVAIRGNSNAQQMQLYFGSRIYENYRAYGVKPTRKDLPPFYSIGTEYETEWMTQEEIGKIKNAWRNESLDGGKRVIS